jgi:hypothetical protein
MEKKNVLIKYSLTVIILMLSIQLISIAIFKHISQNYTVRGWKFEKNSASLKIYDLRIIVIVYNRNLSLMRLLDSLNEADYENDAVKLEVWIDRSKTGIISNDTFQAARGFLFKFGDYMVIARDKHAGICGQWSTSWKPHLNSSEIAVILEDDLTVSPYFYKYLKMVHKKYDRLRDVNGYALQGSSIKLSLNPSRGLLEGPKDALVYLYPVVGSWGFSPNTRNWIRFINWFNFSCENSPIDPMIPNSISYKWYKGFKKSGKTDTMWTIWHAYFAYINHEYTLYSNFKGKIKTRNQTICNF